MLVPRPPLGEQVYIWPSSDNGHELTDFIVTLGGDGTVLWSTQLFPGPVPPLLPFNLGSLGFMANFKIQDFKKQVKEFITGKSGPPARLDDGEIAKDCSGLFG